MTYEIKRIVIIGISGTGKSSLGYRLTEKIKVPLYHMDSLIWGPNWTEQTEHQISFALSKIALTRSWIIEGWIDDYSVPILNQSDVVLYLDYPGWLAAWGGLQRWWKYRGAKRPEMPKDCIERFNLAFLYKILFRKERAHIENILSKVPGIRVIRIKSRPEMKNYL